MNLVTDKKIGESKLDKYSKMYLKIASSLAEESQDKRLKVGCVFVKDRTIIVEGINGTLRGWETNVCENKDNDTADYTVQSEMNAILKAARIGRPLDGSTLYVNIAPCVKCSKHLIGVGVKEVIFSNKFKNELGTDLLIKAGVKVTQLNLSNNH